MATAGVLSDGTTRHDAIEWGTALESLGGRYTARAGWTAVTATLDLPAVETAAAAELLVESVRTPALREADIRRALGDQLASRQEVWAQPGQQADVALRAALFDSDSRFGRPLDGSPATVAMLDPTAVRACHNRWTAGQSALLVAGDLSKLPIDTLASTVLNAPQMPEPIASPANSATTHEKRLVRIDCPGAVQSSVRIGQPVPSRREISERGINLQALRIGASILGESFTSRLNHQLREVQGFAYSAYARFNLNPPIGQFNFSAQVRPDATAATVEESLRIIRDFVVSGPTATELEQARSYLVGAIPIGMQTVWAVGTRLLDMFTNDMTADYLKDECSQLLAATLEDVHTAFRDLIRPDELITVIEGDQAALAPSLIALGL
jgi:zinc protease